MLVLAVSLVVRDHQKKKGYAAEDKTGTGILLPADDDQGHQQKCAHHKQISTFGFLFITIFGISQKISSIDDRKYFSEFRRMNTDKTQSDPAIGSITAHA